MEWSDRNRRVPTLKFYLHRTGIVASPLRPFCNEEETMHLHSLSGRRIKIHLNRVLETIIHNIDSEFTEMTIVSFGWDLFRVQPQGRLLCTFETSSRN